MKTFRAAVIQARSNPACAGLHADPFEESFSFDDLVACVDAWLRFYEPLAAHEAGSGARLVVLTEDFTHVGGAMMYLDDPTIFRRIAAHQAEVVPRALGALAGRLGIHLIACYFTVEGDANRNVAELFGPDGRSLGRYHKVHLPPYERWLVAAGSEYPVFETELGRIGMLVCHDQMWPEPFACLAAGGAELVVQPSAATIAEYRMLCRSADHHVFYISACPRGSMIAAPRELILARAGFTDPAVAAAELDGSLVELGSEGYYDGFYSGIREHRTRELRSRRPETYGRLTERLPPALRRPGTPELAETPDRVAAIYARYREARRAMAAGEPEPFHWDYWADDHADGEDPPRE